MKNYLFQCVVVLITSFFSLAASFDCSKAHTDAELEICKNTDLKELDILLNEVYRTALKLDKVDAKAVQQSQRVWLQQRPLRKRDYKYESEFTSALYKSYKLRIRELLQSDSLRQALWSLQLEIAKQAKGLRNLALSALVLSEVQEDQGCWLDNTRYQGEYISLTEQKGLVILPLSMGAYQGTWGIYQVDIGKDKAVKVVPLGLNRPEGYICFLEDEPAHYWLGNWDYDHYKSVLVFSGYKARGIDPPNIEVRWKYTGGEWQQVYHQRYVAEKQIELKDPKLLEGEWECLQSFRGSQNETFHHVRRVFRVSMKGGRHVGGFRQYLYGSAKVESQQGVSNPIYYHSSSKRWDHTVGLSIDVPGKVGRKWVFSYIDENTISIQCYTSDGMWAKSEYSGIYLRQQ